MWEPWGNFGKLYWAKGVRGTGGLWEKKQGLERYEEILAAREHGLGTGVLFQHGETLENTFK